MFGFLIQHGGTHKQDILTSLLFNAQTCNVHLYEQSLIENKIKIFLHLPYFVTD